MNIKRLVWWSVLCGVGALVSGQSGAAETADWVFTNARVYTVDAHRPWVQAVAVKGAAILAVGSNDEMTELTGPQTRSVDLQGRLLLPGFIDGHNHFLSGPYAKRGVKLNGARDKAELLQRVADYIRANPDRTRYTGYGWSYPMMGEAKGTRQELDALAADKPIILFNEDTHGVWFNTRAMELGGLSPTAADPTPTSHYTRGADGTLAGIAVEPEAWRGMLLGAGVLGGKEMLAAIAQEVFPKLPPAGITANHDMAIWAPDFPQGYLGLELLTEMERAGKLPVRVVSVLGVRDANASAQEHVTLLKQWNERYRTPLVQVTGLKIWADGTTDTHTAVQLQPYADDPATKGESDWTTETLARWIALAYAAGFDVHIHAMGDGSIRRALDAFERVAGQMDVRQRRSALHHLSVIHPDDLPRFKQLGIGGNTTLEWLVTYWDVARTLVGEQMRAAEWDVWKQLIEEGVNVSFGGDIPGTDPDELAPLYQMQVAATGRIPASPGLGSAPPDRIPSREQMVYGYTLAGARQMRLEDRIGSIEEGKLADLIILDRDIFSIPADQLASVKVLMTMMNGNITHLDSQGAAVIGLH
ncbi:amidohydrolase [uncultured Thiodictyon sp.]|uniref:amidohydrolase n=1 Tax=uncultured Thiodictyon sp. TaxID=1846217 RepID=UPI0025E613FF|nr:amidohydrolase [uncultured Thiodictyon sp.]